MQMALIIPCHDSISFLKVLPSKEHLQRVMAGSHALLTWKFYIQSLIASRFTDASGYTPLYIGRSHHYVSTGYGWGFRLVLREAAKQREMTRSITSGKCVKIVNCHTTENKMFVYLPQEGRTVPSPHR